MIQVKALKAFQSRYGFMRVGDQFWSEEGYVKQLERVGGMIEKIRDDDAPIAPANEPARNQSFAAAPFKAAPGKVFESASLPPLSPSQSSEAAKDDGAVKPLLSSQVGRRSRKRTPTGADPNAK